MENMRVGGVCMFLSPSSSPFIPLYFPFLLPLPSYSSLLSLLPQAALVETDSRSDDLEKKNRLLEGEVADLRQNLKEQSQADEQIMALMNTKTKEWQVDVTFPLPDLLLPPDPLSSYFSLSLPPPLFFRSCSLSLDFLFPLSLLLFSSLLSQ